jgi:hypothetical protein
MPEHMHYLQTSSCVLSNAQQVHRCSVMRN